MKGCEESTLDMERSAFERLSMNERLQLRVHKMVCRNCRKYYRDSKAIDRLLRKKFADKASFEFTAKEKEELKRKIAS